MRFLLTIFILFFSTLSLADTPLPSKKPAENKDQSTFQDVIDRAVEAVREEMPMEEKSDVIMPPPLPDIKMVASTQSKTVIDGIPVPSKKPFKVIALRDTPKKATTPTGIIYYEGSGSSDRMAGGRSKSRGTERVYAERVGRLRETDEKSPFKTSKLPKAGKQSYSDPVIVFFKERSPDLEVGQLSILKNDILKPLKRSSNRHVTIYGYAMNNKSKPDEARRLSLSRALMVREYLIDNRIKSDRIEVRTMGSDTPIDPRNRVDVVFDR